jgi:translation initiation factor IF-1
MRFTLARTGGRPGTPVAFSGALGPWKGPFLFSFFMCASPSDAVTATVLEELPQRLFRVRAADGTVIVAGPSPEAKRLGIIVRRGTKVLVRRASHDPARGTILGLAEDP